MKEENCANSPKIDSSHLTFNCEERITDKTTQDITNFKTAYQNKQTIKMT